MGGGSLWAAARCGPPGSDGQVQVLLTSCHIAVATEAAGVVRGGDVQDARREACQASSSSLPNVCNSPVSRWLFLDRGPVLHACTRTHKCACRLSENMQCVFQAAWWDSPSPVFHTGRRSAACVKVYKMFQIEKKKLSQSVTVPISFFWMALCSSKALWASICSS